MGLTITVSAVLAWMVGAVFQTPAPDVLTLLIWIALTLVPFLILLIAAIRILRKRGVRLSRWVAIVIGSGIGMAANLLSSLVLNVVFSTVA